MGHRVELKHKDLFANLSDQIWEFAEPRYEETQSANAIATCLEGFGFSVRRGIAEIPTAFVAEYGSGKPVIGILGEYDALPGLSQIRDACEKMPVEGKECGHGCGHNLLGSGAAEAAVAVKELLEQTGLKGTIRFYGCPAEEGGGGKIYMIRAGCFEDVDVCLTWHPGSSFSVWNRSLAGMRAAFRFHGKSAHAAGNPHMGRSALDAAELMNVGANFLREHVPPDVRIHYAFLDAGGVQPNIVQESTRVDYAVRAETTPVMVESFKRLVKVAKGAAMMTETNVDYEVITSYSSFLPNPVLDSLLADLIKDTKLEFTEEEKKYGDLFARDNNMLRRMDFRDEGKTPGSTDVSDVSWFIPTGQILAVCGPYEALHSWQTVATGCSSAAHRGMHAAAEVIANAAVKLLETEDLVIKTKEAFEKARGSFVYTSLLPEGKPVFLKK